MAGGAPRSEAVRRAHQVIENAWTAGRPYDLASQAAFALESACLLQSPETAAELEALRKQVAQLKAVRADEHDELTHALGRSAGIEWGDLIEYAAGAVTAEVKLRKRVAELEAAPTTVYRAQHDSIPMGHYTTAAAARAHCEAYVRREIPGASLDWIEDEEDGVAELVAAFGEDERPTGYLVTALTVTSAYDEEADE